MSIFTDELRVPSDLAGKMQVEIKGSSVIVMTPPEQFKQCRGLFWALGVMPPENGRVLGYSTNTEADGPDTLQIVLYDAEAAQAYGERVTKLVTALHDMQALAEDQA